MPAQVINAYCQKKSLEPSTVRFLFDGQRISAEHTPEMVRNELLAALGSFWASGHL